MYRGDWRYDATQKRWFGNPTRSAIVKDLMVAIKHKTGADAPERHHSLAMSKEFMDMLFAWSWKVCPTSKVESLPEDMETLNLITEHLHFRAFASTGWTVWTRSVVLGLLSNFQTDRVVLVLFRNNELIHLQYKHLQFNHADRRAGGSPGDPIFFWLSLEFRKGWQNKMNSENKLRSK